jgi:hypothetical protein
VTQNETTRIKTDRDVLGGSEPTDTEMILALLRKHRNEVVGRSEMDRIIESRVGTDAALKEAGATINLPQQLDLQPALACLHDLGRLLGPG